jgi:MSHA biogenesis protein MshI
MLAFLKKRSRQSGLTAIGFEPEGVCLARIDRSGAQPRLTACECRPAAEGEARVVAQFASQQGLKNAPCTTTLNDEDYQLLVTETPEMKPEEMKSAMRWRIKDLVNFHINDATIDVFDLPGETAPGRQREVYVVAARNEAIQARVDLLGGNGVNLQVIDIPELAQRNLAALLPEDEAGVALLNLGMQGGLLTITRGGLLYLSRNINIGTETLLRTDNRPAYFDQIVLEVQRSLDYYESHFRAAPIRHLVLAPMREEIAGLYDHLAANLGVTVAQMDLRKLLDCDEALDLTTQARCLHTIGAALREEVRAP